MRVLAIDYGLKRSGLAVTDPACLIASALETVETSALFPYLKRFVTTEAVEGFVVGLPVGLDGRETDATPHVRAFIARLHRDFPGLWVETVDERFTSRIAQQTLVTSGKGRKARQDKGALDRISATLILQSWLDRRGRDL